MATINTLPEGLKLADRYQIVRPIGQGGMGVVYLVKDTQLDGEIRAVKTIKPELLNDPKGAVRMKREAIASMKLTHPNIIRIFNYEEWQGMAFIVMEYVDGHTLAHLLAEKDKLTEEEFFPMANQLLDALGYAHSQQIIHQDIKPANIFLTSNGTPKLADFGIAKVLNDTATRLTGVVNSGTLLYMAPEMVKGQKAVPASDYYSLGITFYEMLAGDPPFTHGDIYRLHIEAEPPRIAGLSQDAESLLDRLLAKEPDQRLEQSKTPTPTAKKTTKPEKTSGTSKYEYGYAAYKAGEFQAAISLFEEALELDPGLASLVESKLDHCRSELEKARAEEKANQAHQAELARIPAYLLEAQEHLEKDERRQAIEFYKKVLKLDPDNPEANSGLAKVQELERLEADKQAKAEAELERQRQEEKERRAKKEAERRAASAEARRQAHEEQEKKRKEHIKKHGWKYAAVAVLIIVAVVFINWQAEQARLAGIEADAYEQALEENSIASWKEFLADYPNSQHAASARSNINTLKSQADKAFKQAEATDSVESWKQFIASWPGADQLEKAKENLSSAEKALATKLREKESSAFQKAKRANTISGWQNYLDQYPNSSNSPAARSKLSALQTAEIKRKEQEQIAENRRLEAAKKEKLREEESSAFQKAKRVNTISGWQDYLDQYPNSSNSHAARSKLSALQTAENQREAEKRRQAEQNKYRNLIKMAKIPAGSFMMGSDNGDSDEKPVHRVTISKDFYMGIYEVTQAQYQAVMGKNPSNFRGDNNPVEQVSWNDAQEFCRKLSQKTGQKYRLPTEAEWEYAARAGTTTKYYWGKSYSEAGNFAWFIENSNYITHPVGTKIANRWGLHDMSGNVWEWCTDYYNKNFYRNSPEIDPVNEGKSIFRVVRGCDWNNDSEIMRTTKRGRGHYGSNTNDIGIGFRIVLDIVRSGDQSIYEAKQGEEEIITTEPTEKPTLREKEPLLFPPINLSTSELEAVFLRDPIVADTSLSLKVQTRKRANRGVTVSGRFVVALINRNGKLEKTYPNSVKTDGERILNPLRGSSFRFRYSRDWDIKFDNISPTNISSILLTIYDIEGKDILWRDTLDLDK